MQPRTQLFSADHYTGLSSLAAEQLLKTVGANTLPSDQQRALWRIAFATLIEPMSLLLLAAGVIYLLLGDLRDALMLLAFVFVLLGISIFQQNKTERALTALRNLSSPRALVIRDGEQKRIAGSEVVPGDIVFLKEGDRVPADGILLSSINLTVDESILTGESVPVHKLPAESDGIFTSPGSGDSFCMYSGTLVVQGQAFMQVIYTGIKTEIGKISKAIQALPEEKTWLKHEMEKLVKYFAVAGIILCVILVTLYGTMRGDWLAAFLAGITLAMAMIPEEFPVVLTIFMALGAWRLSRHQVLIRRIPMVEALGSATVLCVDKTGTLTENRMVAQQLVTQDATFDLRYQPSQRELPEKFHQLVEYGILASQRDPYDPMEKAIHAIGRHYLANTEHIHKDWSLIQEYPLSKELMAMSLVWESTENDLYTIAAKGAPEAIIDLCHLTEEQAAPILAQVAEMAVQGLRIIAVAKSSFTPPTLPDIQHDFNFEYVGLIGLSDPIRTTAKAAIQQCYAAGIRVIMITGDYPQTAHSIAKEVGLNNLDRILTGSELQQMNDKALAEVIKSVNVFARMVPEQKLRLVQALKNNGEVVAMTGDGVNDAPALKAANIGLAMGGRGTDVAREAAGIVLLDDDFSAIVYAVKMGRRIFDNIRKAISYILSIHVPISGLSLIPVLVDWPLILLPLHVAFLHLIIDPACSIVFEAEPEEKNIMQRPPRKTHTPILNLVFWIRSLLTGSSILGMVLLVYALSLHWEQSLTHARTMAFTTLIIANLSLIISNCGWGSNFFSSLIHSTLSL
ncbi:MAG: cation-translocating P-type ATPase, partial [Gammaproteobacteria bacterium]